MTAVLLGPDAYEQIVALASESTIRRRVYGQYAWDTRNANKLAYEIHTIRQRGYDDTLSAMRQKLGVQHPAQLRDEAVQSALLQDSRGVAIGVVRTHNQSLRKFLDSQPRGLAQRELSARARAWQAERAGWKTAQIAKTELGEGRAQALADVLDKNGLSVLSRFTPQSAQCPLCAAAVARGWMRPDQLDQTPPLHPNCVHSLEVRDSVKQQIQGKGRVWLGSWQRNVPE